MKPKRDDEDARLFREAVKNVKPLNADRHAAHSEKPSPRVRYPRRPRSAHLDEPIAGSAGQVPVERDEELSFRRPGVQLTVLRKLRRGDFGVQAEIDLHGLTGDQASRALHQFLNEAVMGHARCVRVIHGKGLRSADRLPVLKNAVSNLMRRTPQVMAFVSAKQADGGTGATYVLLRS